MIDPEKSPEIPQIKPDVLPKNFGEAEAKFTEVVHKWQAFFADASLDDARAAIDTATTELDRACPYDGKYCHFSGPAAYPKIQEDGSLEIVAEAITSHGWSQGIIPYDLNDSGEYRLYSMFELPYRVPLTNPFIGPPPLYAYLELDRGSVMPVDDIEEAIYEPPIEIETKCGDEFRKFARDQWAIDKVSGHVVRLFRSNNFRKLEHDEQVDKVEDLITLVDTYYSMVQRRAEVTIANAEYCFKPTYDETGETGFKPIKIGELVLGGLLLGFDSLERTTLRKRPIRCNKDMIDPKAGLCMIVELAYVSDDHELKPKEVCMIPVSSQEMEREIMIADDGAAYKVIE